MKHAENCTCQGGWVCPSCWDAMEDENIKLKKRELYFLECMKDIRNRIHVDDKGQIENNLNEAIRELYRR